MSRISKELRRGTPTGLGRTIRPMVAEDAARWDEYVERHPEGTVFHTAGWKRAVESNFPYRAEYLLAESDGRITGVLPLFWIKNPLVRGYLVSVAMGVQGGVLADDEATASELAEAASERARVLEASYIAYRNTQAAPGDHLVTGGSYSSFVKELPEDPEACLPGLPRKARAAARKAIRDFGLEASVAGSERLDLFFDLFARNKRHLGSPIYPRAFFAQLMQELPSDLLFVHANDRIVSGVLSFYYKGDVIPYYSGADDRFESMQFSNFMYLKLMEEGARRGLDRFDFGRSRDGSGSFKFKKNQGFEPVPLHYQYELVVGDSIPDLSPDNSRFGIVQATWKRLPLPLVKWLGPRLIRYFP